MITALPPPWSSPARAFLYDMPRDRLSASSDGLLARVGVRVEAGAAEGGAQGGGVDGDDGLQAAGAVLAEHDLLVAALLRSEQGVQGRTLVRGPSTLTVGRTSVTVVTP